nr:protein 92 [synthetic construct]
MASLAGLVRGAARHLQSGSTPENPYQTPPNDGCGLTPFGCVEDFWCDPKFGLADAKYGYCFVEAAHGELIIGPDSNASWLLSRGTDSEKLGMQICQWTAFAIAIFLLGFYAFSAWKATCGWEEVYVCLVEITYVTLEIFNQFDSPSMIYLSTGNAVYFMRYTEWVLCCPVILIHLSNLSGLKNDYSKRTMRLIVSCLGMLVFGMAGGLSTGWLKWFLFGIGCLYSGQTYFQSAKCYVEAHHCVPKGHCRLVIKLMAYAFFASWGTYPVLWVIGPEGLKHTSWYTNTIAHTLCDILSKELWPFLGHHLRIKIREHILIHGDIRKKTTIVIAGESLEVEEFVDEEDEDTV